MFMGLRSIIFKIAFAVTSILISIGILLLIPTSYRVRLRFATFWSDATLWLLKVICNIDYEVKGMENVPDRPCVLVFNHQSTWETTFSPQVTRKLMWVLKREILYIPFFGWAMASLKPVAINRRDKRSAMMQVIEQGRDRIVAAGLSVSMCPEGTRCPPDAPKPFKQGAARLAVALNLPMLPIAHNAGVFWPKKGPLRQGTISVEIFPPLEVEGKTPHELNKTIENIIQSKARKLVAHAQQA